MGGGNYEICTYDGKNLKFNGALQSSTLSTLKELNHNEGCPRKWVTGNVGCIWKVEKWGENRKLGFVLSNGFGHK